MANGVISYIFGSGVKMGSRGGSNIEYCKKCTKTDMAICNICEK